MAGQISGTEASAIAVTSTAPAWYGFIQQLNGVLATISLALGICFTIYTWRRSIKERRVEHDDSKIVRDYNNPPRQ